MKIHDGVHVENSSSKACLLNRSLYGLKQTPRHWYKRFDNFMISIGYDRSKYDASSSRYIFHIYLLLCVDDSLIASKNLQNIEDLKLKLNMEFEMKDLRNAQRIIGMDINRDEDRRILSLTQTSYLNKVLIKYKMNTTKPSSTPLNQSVKLSCSQSPATLEEEKPMVSVPYASAVGSIGVLHGMLQT